MIRSILVPLDGSAFGEHALPLALSVARRAGAALQLVHVHVPPAPLYSEGLVPYEKVWDAKFVEQSRKYLDDASRRLAGVSTSVRVEPVLMEGAVPEAVLERVKSTAVDLVVMTTHGRGALARAWLGSIADELVRRLTIPLLLVRPNEAAVNLKAEPVLRRLLVPLDGSELAERILEPAVALGTLMDAEYRLLRIVKPVVFGGYTPIEPGMGSMIDPTLVKELDNLHKDEERRAQAYLDQVAERLRGRSLRVQTHVVTADQVAAGILTEAQGTRTDAIALETHGRRGLPRLFLGSVADKVLRGAHVPILLQRPAEK
jgi:nucleotide-binding universal stress UspA family protein